LNRKVLYHFAIFAIVNEILITTDCQISTTYAECKRVARCDRSAMVAWSGAWRGVYYKRYVYNYTRAARSGSPVSI